MFLLMCLRCKPHIIHFYYPHILEDTKKKNKILFYRLNNIFSLYLSEY